MALGCPVEKIRKPFWYKHVKGYIFPNRCPGAECEPNQWHAQFWASSTVTITPPLQKLSGSQEISQTHD